MIIHFRSITMIITYCFQMMADEETEERMKKLSCRKKGEIGMQHSQDTVCF